ncbi:WD40 repeat domain-containing protein [Metabacillus dongyingensis]|uniref:WD40 repeat domain-containing protein n=1 Tax=Metabacillus dongyingensis TaxID=2874282 RepID=UPI001CBBA34D|nr:WD40 repeat domain-containing protein [Metabacillus dongyingensis]UAL50184.1 WD40 repeat domain-containing protein [Metabacillus dongyingensis]
MKSGYFKMFLLLTLIFVIAFPKTGSASQPGTVEKLGTMHHSIGILSAVFGKGPNGEQAMYAVSSGSPAVLNVINVDSGEKISSHKLVGAAQGWGSVIAPDGRVYVAGSANLYRYSPETDTVENLGRAVSTESTLWRLKSDSEGRIYGGSFPNGKLYMYDPEKDQFTDFGPMAEGEQYLRSHDLYKDKVYIGMGSRAKLIEFTPKTGEKKEILLPEGYKHEKYVYDLDIRKHFLFARVTDSSTLLVYDLKKKEWINEITGVKGGEVSPAGPKNKIYFNKDNELHAYDLKKHLLEPTGFKDTWSAKGYGWADIDDKNFEGPDLVSSLFNGRFWVYNPKTGASKFMETQMEGQPIPLQSIGLGPDGNIYTSGYLSGGFARYSPAENKITSFSGFGQAENMISTDKYLYLGVYSGGYIYRYDPDLPYEHDPSNADAAINPKRLFTLKPHGQDRPFGFAEGDGKVFIGTVPDYGQLGGALTILDEANDHYEVFRNVVNSQSVISLQYKNNLVYGGTSVSGGLGVVPSEKEAKLFIFDPSSNQKIYEGTPLPGEKAIGALAFDKDGFLWGMSPGKIFKFDPKTKEVLLTKELFPYSWEGVGHYWRGAFLSANADGKFYGTSLGKLFSFDPVSLEMKILDSDASLFTMDKNGDLYFARGTDLYRYNR